MGVSKVYLSLAKESASLRDGGDAPLLWRPSPLGALALRGGRARGGRI